MNAKKTALHDISVASVKNQIQATRLFISMVTAAIATAATITYTTEEAGAFSMSSSESFFTGSSMSSSLNQVIGSGSNCMSMNQSLPGLTQFSSMCAPKPPSTGGVTIGGSAITSTGGITINGVTVTNSSTSSQVINANSQTSSSTSSQVINANSQTSSSTSSQVINANSQTSSSTSSQTNLSQSAVMNPGSASNEMSMNQSLPGLIQSISMSAPQPLPPQVGNTQMNPVMPTAINNSVFSFLNVGTGLWFDPPTAFGFQYTMTDNSLFTNILDFPTGFDQPFAVSVDDILLGNFTAGQAVNFSDYSNVLGDLLLSGSGVSEFSVTGINVDPTNPSVFPIQLQFNTETASFDQIAISNHKASKSVPEPSSLLGLLFIGASGLFSALHKRQEHQKERV